MNLAAILSKTAKGAEELETRKYKLDQRSRALLIVVNGKSTGAELLKKFEQMGDVTPMLEQLLANGFVAEGAGAAAGPAAAAPSGVDITALRAELSQAITAVLGPGGDAITEQLEECRTLEELRAYIGGKRAMLESALGKKGAQFWAKAASLIG
jgi:hypothetical protein